MNRDIAMSGLTYVKGLGPVWIKRLLAYFDHDPIKIWQAPYEELEKALHGRCSLIESMQQIVWEDVEKDYKIAQSQNIELIMLHAPGYSRQLTNIYDPPPVLYRQGTWCEQDEQAIAIVGTRHPSPYGLRQAYRLAKELATQGITVVSGLARGIDIAAHRGALAGHGRTLAVLGSGLGCLYPEEHRKEAASICQNGALLSEYPVLEPPQAGYFPQRNRIISGLSLGIIVIEAGEKSGALITAHTALEQGREVFALPGEIDRSETIGTHRLIQQGAKLITCLDDVLEEILAFQPAQAQKQASQLTKSLSSTKNHQQDTLFDELDSASQNPQDHNSPPAIPPPRQGHPLTLEQQQIWDVLSGYPQHIDDVVMQLTMPPSQISSTLLMMELQGIVHLWPGHRYARNEKA